jgi:mRNA interferase RelE/StbE
MAERYSLEIQRAAVVDLESVPLRFRRRLLSRIRKLSSDPAPVACEQISGGGRYRLRYGEWRIIYMVDETSRSVLVVKVNRRQSVVGAL